MSLQIKSTVAGLAALIALCGCQKKDDVPAPGTDITEPATTPPPSADASAAGATNQAVAQLSPTQGNKASGTVTFTLAAEGVKITLDLTELTPGPHGFHVHEVGDCSAPDASSAGEHFNPTNMPHGAPDSDQRHVGDFGNLQADPNGNAHAEFVDKHLSLEGDASVIGRAAVVHEKPDDMATQPSGNSGARIACGVIQAGASAPPAS